MKNSNIPLSKLPSDIIQTHILPRLSVTDLASLSSVSSELHSVVTSADTLWKDLATRTWPSIANPRIQRIISSFPTGYRSFFYHPFPYPSCHDHQHNNTSSTDHEFSALIVAVDLFLGGDDIIFSASTDMVSWSGPIHEFPVSPLDSKDGLVGTLPGIDFLSAQALYIWSQFAKNVRQSWILIDPATKRAVNQSISWTSINYVSSSAGASIRDKGVFKFSAFLPTSGSVGSVKWVVCTTKVHVCLLNGKLDIKKVNLRLRGHDKRLIVDSAERVDILRAVLEGERGDISVAAEQQHYLDISRKRLLALSS